MSSTALIQATGLNTHYGASHILRGVNFTVGAGQTIGLMGRNGMGKTTLLKSIMGLVKPSGGSVHIKGKDMTGCVHLRDCPPWAWPMCLKAAAFLAT
jgi:branched-chain amino acid transport system ATP-binding protein